MVKDGHGRLRPTEGLRRHAQSLGHAVFPSAFPALLAYSVALVDMRAQAQPTGEVLLRGKTTDIDAAFRQDHQSGADVNAVDERQVHTESLEQELRGRKANVVALVTPATRPRLERFVTGAVGQLSQRALDLLIAFANLLVLK